MKTAFLLVLFSCMTNGTFIYIPWMKTIVKPSKVEWRFCVDGGYTSADDNPKLFTTVMTGKFCGKRTKPLEELDLLVARFLKTLHEKRFGFSGSCGNSCLSMTFYITTKLDVCGVRVPRWNLEKDFFQKGFNSGYHGMDKIAMTNGDYFLFSTPKSIVVFQDKLEFRRNDIFEYDDQHKNGFVLDTGNLPTEFFNEASKLLNKIKTSN